MPVHKASMELLVRLEERDHPCPLCVQGLNSQLALQSDDTQVAKCGAHGARSSLATSEFLLPASSFRHQSATDAGNCSSIASDSFFFSSCAPRQLVMSRGGALRKSSNPLFIYPGQPRLPGLQHQRMGVYL